MNDAVTSSAENWPYQPVRITRGKSCLNGGIITELHCRGLQAEITSRVHLPVSIMEMGEDGNPKRIDAPYTNLSAMCEYCRRRREDNDSVASYRGKCEKSEKDFARLWHGDGNISQAAVDKIFDEIVQPEYEAAMPPRVIGAQEKSYIEYNCPISGFKKLIFPIRVEGRKIGLLMTGQRYKENSGFKISDSDGFLSTMVQDPEALALIESDSKKRGRTEKEYGEIIQSLKDAIQDLEKELSISLDRRRKEIITDKITEIIDEFENKNAKELQRKILKDRVNGFWKIAQQTAESVIKHFRFSFYIIYARGIPMGNRKGTLSRKVVTPDTEELKRNFKETIYAKNVGKTLPTCESEKRAVLNSPETKEIDNFNLVPLGSLQNNWNIVIAVGYPKENPRNSPVNKSSGNLAKGFKLFNNAFTSAYETVMAHSLADIYTLHLRYQKHELNQLTIGIDGIRHVYFRASAMRDLSAKETEEVRDDLQDYTHQIELIGEGMGIVADGGVKPKMGRVLPYGQLLYKWRKSFRQRANEQQVRIPSLWNINGKEDENHPAVYGNFELLEQIVYNFLTNALKYCHRGSNIEVEWRSSPDDVSSTLFTVTDYGTPIPPHIDIYGLYSRGATEMSGFGLGLYIARKVADLHGGELSAEDKKVSTLHIPLLAALMKHWDRQPWLVKQFFEERKLAKYREEHERLKTDKSIGRIVAGKWNGDILYFPQPARIKSEIDTPTYEVQFTAKLPRLRKGGAR